MPSNCKTTEHVARSKRRNVERLGPVHRRQVGATVSFGPTGEVIRLAEAVGPDALHLAFIEVHPFADADSGALDTATLFALRLRRQGALVVSRAGRRFVDEASPHDMISRAAVATGGRPSYTIFSAAMLARAAKEETAAQVADALARGRICRAAGLAELGETLGICGEALAETARRFTGFLAAGSDGDFGRPLTAAMLPLADGRYYAIPHRPAVHFTAGGLRVNPQAQVIDIWGAPNPQLYAAGEVTGGIHGMGRARRQPDDRADRVRPDRRHRGVGAAAPLPGVSRPKPSLVDDRGVYSVAQAAIPLGGATAAAVRLRPRHGHRRRNTPYQAGATLTWGGLAPGWFAPASPAPEVGWGHPGKVREQPRAG